MKSYGESTKDTQIIANLTADYYEQLFEEPTVIRPHPYVDTLTLDFDNSSNLIPLVTYPEVLRVLVGREKKRSRDSHQLSPFLLGNIWAFFRSDVQSLAKKDAIYTPDLTHPISLLDSFLKVQERLYLNRFLQVLEDRTILPDSQSGFRSGHRLQTRILLLIEQILSCMSNSSPVGLLFLSISRMRLFNSGSNIDEARSRYKENVPGCFQSVAEDNKVPALHQPYLSYTMQIWETLCRWPCLFSLQVI